MLRFELLEAAVHFERLDQSINLRFEHRQAGVHLRFQNSELGVLGIEAGIKFGAQRLKPLIEGLHASGERLLLRQNQALKQLLEFLYHTHTLIVPGLAQKVNDDYFPTTECYV